VHKETKDRQVLVELLQVLLVRLAQLALQDHKALQVLLVLQDHKALQVLLDQQVQQVQLAQLVLLEHKAVKDHLD
jgi:hypothetical protein